MRAGSIPAVSLVTCMRVYLRAYTFVYAVVILIMSVSVVCCCSEPNECERLLARADVFCISNS